MTDILIGAHTRNNWQRAGTTATLRIWFTGEFRDTNGVMVDPGNGTDSFYQIVPCTVNPTTHVISIPSFTLPSTLDGTPANIECNGRLYDASNSPRTWLFQGWSISNAPTSLPFGDWFIFNLGSSLSSPPESYLNSQEVLALIASQFAAYAQGMFSETPSGTINGVNGTFTLSHTPIAGTLLLFLNGELQVEGSLGAGTESFTLSGATITHLLPPQIGDRLLAVYRTTGGLVAGGTIPTQIQEGGGPTILSLGSWADGLFARRVGGVVIGDDPLLDTGNIIIGADTGSIGTSTVALQTRGLTRLQITNAGNVSVVNNLGINFSVPTAKLHIKPSYADGINAAEDVIKVSNPNGTTFAFQVQQSMQGGNPNDDVMWWGWNLDQADPYGVASIHFAMERQFGTVWEVHLECHIPSGANPRPWTWSIDRTTGAATVVTTGDSYWSVGVQGHAPDTTNQIDFTAADILFTGRTGPVHIKADIALFETLNNGGATGKQFSIRPLPSDNAQSWLVFGDPAGGGGPSIAPVSGGFRFYTGGSTLDPAILSLNRFQAYGGTWGANAKAVLDGDLRLASTQSVYFFPTADPFGSPDVQLVRSGVGILSVINPNSGLEATVLATHNTTNGYKFNGTKVVGVQGAAVADATDAASVILRLNDLLARLRAATGHGLIA